MRVRLLLLSVFATASAGLVLARAEQERGGSAFHMLDVGQGDALFLRSGSADVVVDGGPDATILQRLGELRPAWDRTIDVVVLTHPQLDHMAGLVPVLRRYRVGLLLLPKIASESPLFAALLDAAREQKVPIRFAWPGQQIRAPGLTLTVLAPGGRALQLARKNANNGCVVLRADVESPGARFSALLTGDIERVAEQEVVRVAGNLLDVDVLKVAHHGSKTSTSSALLRAVTPELAFVSVGAKNRYGHPASGVIRRFAGIRTLRTDRAGTISLLLDRVGMRLVCAHGCLRRN